MLSAISLDDANRYEVIPIFIPVTTGGEKDH